MVLWTSRFFRQTTQFNVLNSNRKHTSQYFKHSCHCLHKINNGNLAGHAKEHKPYMATNPNFGLSNLNYSTSKKTLIDVERLKLPHKYWRWWQRLYIRWHFGSKFDEESFFRGVIYAFLYISDCIANGKTRELYDLVTDEGMKDVPLYMTHALNVSQEAYSVEETDLVYLHVRSARIRSMEQYDEHRNVKVFSLGVWITYIRDFQKKLAEKKVDPDDTVKDQIGIFREVFKDVFQENRIAVFEFQRVYDQTLENALSDWMVSGIMYQVPELMK